jgi:cytochrome c-type biogenesis protein
LQSAGTILVLLLLGVIAGLIGNYLLFLDSTVAWSVGGILMIAMGPAPSPVQTTHQVNRLILKSPVSHAVAGTFLVGLFSRGDNDRVWHPEADHCADLYCPVPDCHAGIFNHAVYTISLSIPLIIIITIDGAFGQKIKY